jgi:hypothetical protein
MMLLSLIDPNSSLGDGAGAVAAKFTPFVESIAPFAAVVEFVTD